MSPLIRKKEALKMNTKLPYYAFVNFLSEFTENAENDKIDCHPVPPPPLESQSELTVNVIVLPLLPSSSTRLPLEIHSTTSMQYS